MPRIFTQPNLNSERGQYAPDFITSFLNFRGVNICRIVMKNKYEKQQKNLIFYRSQGGSA